MMPGCLLFHNRCNAGCCLGLHRYTYNPLLVIAARKIITDFVIAVVESPGISKTGTLLKGSPVVGGKTNWANKVRLELSDLMDNGLRAIHIVTLMKGHSGLLQQTTDIQAL